MPNQGWRDKAPTPGRKRRRTENLKPKPHGRPPKYTPEYDKLAYSYSVLGYNRHQIAEEMGVNVATLYDWCAKYPSFDDSLDNGKKEINNLASSALALKLKKRTLTHQTIFVDKRGQQTRKTVIEEVDPDSSVLNNFLNRRHKTFQLNIEEIAQGGDKLEQLIQAIAVLQPDKLKEQYEKMQKDEQDGKEPKEE